MSVQPRLDLVTIRAKASLRSCLRHVFSMSGQPIHVRGIGNFCARIEDRR